MEDGEEDSLSILAIPGKNTSQSTDQITPDEILSPALQVFLFTLLMSDIFSIIFILFSWKNYNFLQTQRAVAALLSPLFSADGLVVRCVEHAATLDHVMDFTRHRALGSLFSMLNQGVR